MKRFTVFISLVCLYVFILPVFADGILEQNGYATYIGKSKSLVKLISPDFVDTGDNMYLVDYTEDSHNNEIFLFTEFDQNDNVKAVGVIIGDNGDFITSGDPLEGLSAGLKVLGIDAHSATDLTENDGIITITTSNNIACFSQKEVYKNGQKSYTTYCLPITDGRQGSIPGFKKEDEVVMGCFEQDNNFRNDCEPIEWLIVARKNDRALLVSKYALETMPYAPSLASRWEKSTIREWLNTEFLENAFSSEDQKKIITVSNKNRVNPKWIERHGETFNTTLPDTEDTIFILSDDEIEKYFPTEEMRQCKSTPYVKEQMVAGIYKKEYCYWWARTSDTWLTPGGKIIYEGLDANAIGNCIRPAMWVDLSTMKK